jgi:hypothetical protein
MSLILSGTNGLSDVDGTAATPAIRGTDANTGIFFPAADQLAASVNGVEGLRLASTGLGIGTNPHPGAKLHVSGGSVRVDNTNIMFLNPDYGPGTMAVQGFSNIPLVFCTNNTERLRISADGNLGLGVTPSAWSGSLLNSGAFQLGAGYGSLYAYSNAITLGSNVYYNSNGNKYFASGAGASAYQQIGGVHYWLTAPSGTAGNAISFTQAMTLTAGGQLLVGTTSGIGSNTSVVVKGTSAGEQQLTAWSATTSGDPYFAEFATEASYTARGSIRYNRATGLTNYNTTSDYRAKYIISPVTDSGAVIDSVPVYMGKMKGATQERPMFIAHEVPAYAHTGEKDAVDAEGNPVYQQMDASALVPVMWAELKSLRIRVAQLEVK